MMYSMMTRRIQNVLQRPKVFDGLGVYPEHVQVAELMMHHELRWGYSQRQREVEDLRKNNYLKNSIWKLRQQWSWSR